MAVARVRVPERFTVIDAGGGEFRLHSLTFSLAVTDDARAIVSHLLRMLDERPMSLDDIAEALPTFERDEVDVAVAYLLDAGALEAESGEKEPLSPADRLRFRAQVSFFSHFTPPADAPATDRSGLPRTGADFQARLRAAHVVVLGAGQLGSQLVRDLALSGVGRLTSVDSRSVTLEDLHLGGWFGAAPVGAPRAEVVCAQVAAVDPGIDVVAAPEPEGAAATEELLREATFAVLARDDYRPAEYDLVNRAALATRTPWTSGRRAGFEFQVGPTVLPFETSCYACADLRLKSNLADFGENRLVENFLDRDRLRPEALAISPGSALLALEVVKALTFFAAPATCSAIYAFNLLTMQGRLHPVLKIPRCTSCGRPSQARPTIHAWQQTTESASP